VNFNFGDWSTNYRDLDVSLDPLKCTFLGYISALRGCCALKFLHALNTDQGYLVHTPTDGSPPKKIIVNIKKFGLKFSVCASINSSL